MKLIFKKLRYALGESVLDISQYVMSRLPLAINRLVLDILFSIAYPFFRLIPAFRKTIMKNLKTAFGNELSKKEIDTIARRTLRNIFHIPGYLLYYCFPRHHDRLRRDITISGIEHLRSAVKEGKGVIGLGAHMMGFLLLTVRLTVDDVPFVILTKDQRNKIVRDRLTYLKDINGVRYINADSPDKGKHEITAALDRNELVYLIADERKKHGGLSVPFFGKKALTAVGPAVFSLKTGAPILPIFIADKGNGFVIDILPPLENPVPEKNGHRVYELTLLANKAIEEYVRKYPDQWIWSQQRWRI